MSTPVPRLTFQHVYCNDGGMGGRVHWNEVPSHEPVSEWVSFSQTSMGMRLGTSQKLQQRRSVADVERITELHIVGITLHKKSQL